MPRGKNITITVNTGGVTGTGAARYSLSPTSFSGTLQPLASPGDLSPNFALQVTYLPSLPLSGADDVAQVEIDTDDPKTPTAVVALTGRLPIQSLFRGERGPVSGSALACSICALAAPPASRTAVRAPRPTRHAGPAGFQGLAGARRTTPIGQGRSRRIRSAN